MLCCSSCVQGGTLEQGQREGALFAHAFVLAGGLLQHVADAGADWHVLCPLGLFLFSYHRGAVRMNA